MIKLLAIFFVVLNFNAHAELSPGKYIADCTTEYGYTSFLSTINIGKGSNKIVENKKLFSDSKCTKYYLNHKTVDKYKEIDFNIFEVNHVKNFFKVRNPLILVFNCGPEFFVIPYVWHNSYRMPKSDNCSSPERITYRQLVKSSNDEIHFKLCSQPECSSYYALLKYKKIK